MDQLFNFQDIEQRSMKLESNICQKHSLVQIEVLILWWYAGKKCFACYIHGSTERLRAGSYMSRGYLLSSHLESYLRVRLNEYSRRPVVKLCRSVRKITVSALVNSALVPLYRPGSSPGLPRSTHTAVELSLGS